MAKVGQSKKKFLCPVSADPPPIFIQWLKDGERVTELWTRFRIVKDGSLRIKDVELADAGKYTCKATNGFGSIMVNYSLIVVGKCSKAYAQQNNRGTKKRSPFTMLHLGSIGIDHVVSEFCYTMILWENDHFMAIFLKFLCKISWMKMLTTIYLNWFYTKGFKQTAALYLNLAERKPVFRVSVCFMSQTIILLSCWDIFLKCRRIFTLK